MSGISEPTLYALLDRPIAFHRALAAAAGGAAGGVVLSQMMYWQQRVPVGRDGWWYKTQAEFNDETCATRAEIEGVRRRLIDAGVLEYERRGVPAKSWYRLDLIKLTKYVESTVCRIQQTRLQDPACKPAESTKLDCARRQSNTESTSDTTSETCSSSSAHAAAAALAQSNLKRRRGKPSGIVTWDQPETAAAEAVRSDPEASMRKQEHAAAARDWTSEKGPKFANPIVLHNGVESWYPLDLKDAEKLTTDEPDADIRAAVPVVVARGQSPVAALVRREINRQRAKREAEAARPKSRMLQTMEAIDELSERIRAARRPTDAQEVVTARTELYGRGNTLTLPSGVREAMVRRDDELKFIEQMHEYGRITDAERDRQQADVMAKFAAKHQGP